jgi:hypothetical protein
METNAIRILFKSKSDGVTEENGMPHNEGLSPSTVITNLYVN